MPIFEVPIGYISGVVLGTKPQPDKSDGLLQLKGNRVRPCLRAGPGGLFTAPEGCERRAQRCVVLVVLAAAAGERRAGCVRAGCRRGAYSQVLRPQAGRAVAPG